MPIYVACQCGQAFSAPEELAGRTLPCPMCQRPILVAAAAQAPVAAPQRAATEASAGQAFQSMPSAPPHHAKPAARGEQDSPLAVWLAAIGGGLALVVVIGLLIYNGMRRPPAQVATTPTVAAAGNLPSPAAPSAAAASPVVAVATTMPPTIGTPVAAAVPIATQPPAANTPPAADTAIEAAPFTPPSYGAMVATPDGKYEVWLPSEPQKFDPALDLSALLPKPKGQVLLAFGRQGPTEMCSVSVSSDAKAADIFGEMAKAFPGQPDTKTIKFAGVDARQYDFAIEITEGKFAIRTIAFVIDGTGYTLQTMSISGQTDTEENKAFFASFRKKTTAGQ